MALILLIVIGLLGGWFASIATRTEDKYAIRRLIFVGLAASIVTGLIANGFAFIGGLDWIAAGAAIVACAIALAAYHFAMRGRAQV